MGNWTKIHILLNYANITLKIHEMFISGGGSCQMLMFDDKGCTSQNLPKSAGAKGDGCPKDVWIPDSCICCTRADCKVKLLDKI